MIQESITQEDLILYEIVRNPVLFAEFVANLDRYENEEPFELTWYQKNILCDFNSYVSLCCARAVGKTVSLSWLILWLLVFNVFPEDYIVYTVPSKVHLEPVFTSIIRLLKTNSFLSHFTYPSNRGINSSNFSIELKNKATLICRIAGQSNTGTNVVGLHSPFVILDEAGYYPWATWKELQPIVNKWQAGFRLMVSGVPTGLRENNVLYFTDQLGTEYTHHRISAFQNPRFTEKDAKKAEDDYGGVDSEDYIHFILGLHGHPVYALFDRNNFDIHSYPIYKLLINGLEYKDNLPGYITQLSLLPKSPDNIQYTFAGVDLGYTEPTAIIILYLTKDNKIKFLARIRLDKVSYPVQEKLLDYLFTRYNCKFIGIDAGGVGISTVQSLLSPEYKDRNYKNKIVPVDFNANIDFGINENGEEIKQRTKPLSVSILQDYANQHKLIFSSTDPEMYQELERMTYTKNSLGQIIYRTLTPQGGQKGEDHFTSALLCAGLAYYLKNDFYPFQRAKKNRLISFKWLGA